MAFLNPLYLWALLGLAVPVAIHLWSRKEGKTIKVGSIKFLEESDPKQASSIRLNEIWLLILRMLALLILVLILAAPVLKSKSSRSALTYLVEPSLLQQEEMNRIMDTIDPGVEVRLLSMGFPEYSEEDELLSQEIPDYWWLARNMHQLNTDSIVVFTAAYASGFKGRRPQTGENINWIQLIPDEIIKEPIAAVQKGEEVEIISVSGDHTRLEIEKQIIAANQINYNDSEERDSILIDFNGNARNIPLEIADTLKVSLFHDDDLGEQRRYIRSSLRAISEYSRVPIRITDISINGFPRNNEDLLVWLSNSPSKETGATVLVWKPDSLANSLISQGERKNEYYLTGTLNSENIVEEHLPEQLFQLLKINVQLEQEILKHDRRVMPLDEILPLTGSVTGNLENTNTRSISKYLWILLVVLLIAERGLSFYRKQ